MKRLDFPDYESLSKAAADRIISSVRENPDLKICLATGSSPTRCYEILGDMARGEKGLFSGLRVIKLDEWGALPPDHPATCEYYIRKHFIEPLEVDPKRYLSFRGNADDREHECTRFRTELEKLGSIDVSVLGLGLNGHLGFNEPAEVLQPFVHIAKLSPESQQHSMVSSAGSKPDFGYTIGMADLLQSRLIILIVNGSKKKAQLERLLTQKIDPKFPATFLWLHPNCELYTDL